MFQNKSQSVAEIVESIVWFVSEWMRTEKEFNGVDLFDLNRSWATNVMGVQWESLSSILMIASLNLEFEEELDVLFEISIGTLLELFRSSEMLERY